MRALIWSGVLLALAALPGGAAGRLRAGVGRVDITPNEPVWMAGYAARNKPSTGVLNRLSAKALALEDQRGMRVVLVTTDVIGLPRELTDRVAARAMEDWKLDRASLVFNCAHTHTGPVVAGNLDVMGIAHAEKLGFPEQRARLLAYREQLVEQLHTVIGAALGDLAPAQLSYGTGEAGFALNRRQKEVRPVDHSVPVLRVTAPDGKLRAILFGYACHNTTLTAAFTELSGDYSGVAQLELERRFPGATALFLMLCGADQNPEPRSRLELATQHGQALAAEVARVVTTPLRPVSGRLRTTFQLVDLPFAPHTRAQFEEEARGKDEFRVRRAQGVLAAYDNRLEPRKLAFPVQAVRFERGFTLVTLGGEVVVDYALRLKREFPNEPLVVAGYSNDVACYIPSARVLAEGGYEAVDSMIYYGQPGPFTAEVEERVVEGVRRALARVRR